ncbi:XRE family transcriptional regulator [Paenibacillus chitinolyticus]|uniref:Helix-turn-helix transcriptional regulator n=1 Tax=Paenibacillus chitinolyticus TaxID=79263 RepID=A0A410X0D1_9BACL|nr:helix-turn-helix transcriptional regulator [Paenibacillus chitinolyticus]MCY9593756.1 helix-turn-helix transcriptional regulator [Paenibacillus chitinolyticus]MCY9599679.1 helix-turn-helix transcriptional regulator [Paenibacillus chitinolyticus]QAV20146.1 XRE family transcriptional regulator [Paenibacillus chitinolyticus]
MSIGDAFRSYRKENDMTQQEFSEIVPLDRTGLSKIEADKKKAPKDIMRIAAIALDDPRIALAAQAEVTGGACPPWLSKADLHKTTVHLKALEEIEEAFEAMKSTPITKRKDQLEMKDIHRIKNTIMECVEAITALTHYVAILCKEYTISWIGVWKEHRQELKEKKYLN